MKSLSSSGSWNVAVSALLLLVAAAAAGRGWLPQAGRSAAAPPPPQPLQPAAVARLARLCEELPFAAAAAGVSGPGTAPAPVDLRALHFGADPAAAAVAAALLAAKRNQIIASEGVDCRPCSCKEASTTEWSYYPSYYPSSVASVTCVRAPCGVTGSFCRARQGYVDVLRPLLPSETPRAGLPRALAERWTVERLLVNVTCECLPEPTLQPNA